MKKTVFCVALATAMSIGNASAAQSGQSGAAPTTSPLLSPAQRGDMAREFVRRWGVYVQRVYGVDVHNWAERMVATFVHADSANFKRALQRNTYEGAMAELDGRGARLTDATVINTLPPQSDTITPMPPTDGVEDLVFTPLEPCRIVDTRNTAAGAIAGGTNRPFYVWGFANFSAQGGSATDCGGLSQQSPQAVVVNVTVVGQTQVGYATLYPAASASPPQAATMIYYPNVIISNGATVPLVTSGSYDFRIFSERTAHYIVDIVGYYDYPHATALDCDSQFAEQIVNASTNFNFSIPACAGGYTLTGAGCRTAGYNQANWSINGMYSIDGTSLNAFCAGSNITGGQITVQGVAQCCRVPGR